MSTTTVAPFQQVPARPWRSAPPVWPSGRQLVRIAGRFSAAVRQIGWRLLQLSVFLAVVLWPWEIAE